MIQALERIDAASFEQENAAARKAQAAGGAGAGASAALYRSAFLERLALLPGFGRWTAYQVWNDLGEVIAAIERSRVEVERPGRSVVPPGLGARYLNQLVYAGPGTVEALKSLEKTRVMRNIDEDNYGRKDHQAALCRAVALVHAALLERSGRSSSSSSSSASASSDKDNGKHEPLTLSSGAPAPPFRLPASHSLNDTEFLLCEYRKFQLRSAPEYANGTKRLQANKMYVKDAAERARIRAECYV